MNQLNGKQQLLRQRLFEYIPVNQYFFRLQKVLTARRRGQQDKLADEPARTGSFDDIES
ncbi:hypothetical protein D3C85_1875920 [compost metagenome]